MRSTNQEAHTRCTAHAIRHRAQAQEATRTCLECTARVQWTAQGTSHAPSCCVHQAQWGATRINPTEGTRPKWGVALTPQVGHCASAPKWWRHVRPTGGAVCVPNGALHARPPVGRFTCSPFCAPHCAPCSHSNYENSYVPEKRGQNSKKQTTNIKSPKESRHSFFSQ